jgi:hypothetical protein
MAFKVFTAYGAASRPEATLRASGYLFLSKGILRRAGDRPFTHYQLQYDEETGRLGIALGGAARAVVDNAYRPLSKEPSGASLNLMPLLRYYGFPPVTEKRVLPVTFEENLIVIELFDGMMRSPTPLEATATQPVAPPPPQVPMSQPTRDDFDDDIPF